MAMIKFKKLIIYLYCLPVDFFYWLVILFVRLFWGENLKWRRGLWCNFKKNSWPRRSWYKNWGGTTFGHAGIYGPRITSSLVYHEDKHISQFEAKILSIWLVLFPCILFYYFVNSIWMAAIISFFFNGLMVWVPNWIHAWLSNKPIYKGSLHEEAAYGLTNLWEIKNERNRIRDKSLGKSN